METNESIMHQVGDASALVILLGWGVAILPSIATLFTIVWMGIRIYESDTVQRLLGHRSIIDKVPDVED